MSTIPRVGPYRFFFYAGDRNEPRHVHIERDDKIAKVRLDPVRLQKSGGFNRTDIARTHDLIAEHHTCLVEAWHDYFGN